MIPLCHLKDTQETLAAVEHGHSWEETSQLYGKHTEGHRQRNYKPRKKRQALHEVQ